VGWDNAMGRTIALKLTEKEDQIVTQMNKQGISNSELLRNALRQYVESLQQPTDQEHQEKSVAQINENEIPIVQESFEGLKQELEVLRDQTKKTKEQIDIDMGILQRQLYQLSMTRLVTKQAKEHLQRPVIADIHTEVDEFLKKRSLQGTLWRK
jgi:hypothetical protein